MATFTSKTTVDLSALDLFSGFAKIADGTVTVLADGFSIALSASESVEVFGAFTFSGVNLNIPVSGTVTGIQLAVSGTPVLQLDGISVTLAAALAYSASQAAALAAWPLLLSGDDTINGSASADILIGYAGADTIDGGGGSDTVLYSDTTKSVVVTLDGDQPVTVVVDGVDSDTISNIENVTGGGGNDELTGDGGDNVLVGGGGGDVLQGMGGKDVLDGDAGNDTVVYSDTSEAVVLALKAGADAKAFVGGAFQDIVRNVENITGGDGDDILSGDGAANRLIGGAGNDVLAGLGGKDELDGGSGTDTADYSERLVSVSVTLNTDSFVSVLVAGSAEDKIRNIENIIGGAGADTLVGDSKDNRLEGGAGNDTLTGGAGIDELDGGAGSDTAVYSAEAASVVVTLNGAAMSVVTIGGAADDKLWNIENLIGGSGADTLTGDGLANRLDGGGGNDVLNGGDGDDILIGRAGNDTLDGGAGVDTSSYEEKSVSVVVTLAGASDATVRVDGNDEDTLRNIENVIGGTGSDVLTGDEFDNALSGGLGNDVLTGGGGKDVLDGGIGTDTASYAEKTLALKVTLKGSQETSVLVGGVFEDTLRNVENIIGGSGDDEITGDTLANLLEGGGGNDRLTGLAGKDTLDGGTGSDTAVYSERTVAVMATLSGSNDAVVTINGTAEDTLRNVENLVGGTGADTFVGDNEANKLEGGGGDDLLQGGGGLDVLDGGAGSDTASFADKVAAVVVTLNGAADTIATVGGTHRRHAAQHREPDRRRRRRHPDRRWPRQLARRRQGRRHPVRWPGRRHAARRRGAGQDRWRRRHRHRAVH